MTLPDTDRLITAIRITWPAASERRKGSITRRDGAGGGNRVSSALAANLPTDAELSRFEADMKAAGQIPQFWVPEESGALDQSLDARGYALADPTVLFAAPLDDFGKPAHRHGTVFGDEPIQLMEEIWTKAGLDAARFEVMKRVTAPKAYALVRDGQRPAGVSFVALDREIAMVHALEILPGFRRKGLGREVMAHTVCWARNRGARFLALAVTVANGPARALYTSLGMSVVGGYHYRRGTG